MSVAIWNESELDRSLWAEAVKWVKVFASRMESFTQTTISICWDLSTHWSRGPLPQIHGLRTPNKGFYQTYPKYFGQFGQILAKKLWGIWGTFGSPGDPCISWFHDSWFLLFGDSVSGIKFVNSLSFCDFDKKRYFFLYKNV